MTRRPPATGAKALVLPIPTARATAPQTILSLLVLLAVCASVAPHVGATDAPARTSDWPQFRGPQGDAIATDGSGFAQRWIDHGLREVWSAPLGEGYSALAAVDGVIYTQFSTDSAEFLGAFDAETGAERWRVRTDRERKDRFGDGPRATPAVNGDRLFALSAFATLHAVDRRTGEVAWSHDLRRTHGARVPTWGVSASPIVVDDLVLINAGGEDGAAVVAFDHATGAERWRSGSGIPGYSLPIVATVEGARHAVIFAGDRLLALDPADGAVRWSVPWRTAYDVNAAAPVFLPPNRLFISSGYDTGAALFRIDPAARGTWRVVSEWKTRKMKNKFSSSLVRDDVIYGFHDKILQALDAGTGEVLWRHRGFGHGSLFALGDHLVVLGEDGELALAQTGRERYRQAADHALPRGRYWTVPTLFDGRLYVRNAQRLVALEPAASNDR
ncbi:MAG: PQQ-binding-like beta-propeller repeat protein [Acidobacteriota bacterium]